MVRCKRALQLANHSSFSLPRQVAKGLTMRATLPHRHSALAEGPSKPLCGLWVALGGLSGTSLAPQTAWPGCLGGLLKEGPSRPLGANMGAIGAQAEEWRAPQSAQEHVQGATPWSRCKSRQGTAPTATPRAPKSRQVLPRAAPRAAKNYPKRHQEPPRTPQQPPRAPEGPPTVTMSTSRINRKRPRSHQENAEAAMSTRGAPQEQAKSAPGAARDAPRDITS